MNLYSKPFSQFSMAKPILIMVLLLITSICWAADKKNSTPDSNALTPEKLATLDARKSLFTYNSLGRPDPFHPFIDFSQIERSIPTDTTKAVTPLEMYALNQFNLVGIILAGGNHNYALVEDPEKIGYTVNEGDKIGNLSGQVKAIKYNEVIIEEPYLDIFDKQQIRTISLRLRETEDELYLKPNLE